MESNMAVQPQYVHAVNVGASTAQATITPASSDCQCGTPPYATCAAKTTCVASVFVLVIHIINLIAAIISIIFIFQTIPNLIVVIMSGVLLCCYSRCAYITASVLYWIALAMEIGSFMFWSVFVMASWPLFIPFVLGVIALLIAASAASVSCCEFVERQIVVTSNFEGNSSVLQTTLPQHAGLSHHGQPEMAMIQPVARPSGTYQDHPDSFVYKAPHAKTAVAHNTSRDVPPPYEYDLEAGSGNRGGKVLSDAARGQSDEYEFNMPVAITGARNQGPNVSHPSHQSNAATGRSSRDRRSSSTGSVAQDSRPPPPSFEKAV